MRHGAGTGLRPVEGLLRGVEIEVDLEGPTVSVGPEFGGEGPIPARPADVGGDARDTPALAGLVRAFHGYNDDGPRSSFEANIIVVDGEEDRTLLRAEIMGVEKLRLGDGTYDFERLLAAH